MKRSILSLSSILILTTTPVWVWGLLGLGPNPPGSAPYSNVSTTQVQANWTTTDSGDTFNAILSIAPSPSTNGLPGNQTVTTTNLFAVFSGLSPNTVYYVDVDAEILTSLLSSGYTSLGPVTTSANVPTSAAPTGIG